MGERRVWVPKRRSAAGGDEDGVSAGYNERMAWQASRFVLVLVRVGTSVLIGGSVKTSTRIIIQVA